MKIEFYRHNIGPRERKNIHQVLNSIFITTADETRKFELAFSQYLRVRHTLAVSSCTAALHLCLLALGIEEGDEVITTPLTFVATANSIIHAGARPVLVDVEPGTGLIDPVQIEKNITRRTKAIMPVHLFGVMCDMKSIRRIADKHRLKIIEDSAHCIEGRRDGIRPGQLSDAACFSFYATKNITCGEGGAVSTNNPRLAEKLNILRLHGIDKDAYSRYTKGYKHWDMKILGWKYNISDILSCLLLPQLERIEELWKRRSSLYDYYIRSLQGIAGIDFLEIPPRTRSAYHLFTILINNRDRAIQYLQNRGVSVAINYVPIHLLTYYRKNFGYTKGSFPNAERIGSKVLSIPFYPKINNQERKFVVESIKKFLTT